MRSRARYRRRSARPGFAAALAVCMLAAVAGLAAASFYSVVEARRAAHRSATGEGAAAAADMGLARALETWSVGRYDSLVVGGRAAVGAEAPDVDSARADVSVTRITDRLFLVASAATVAAGTAVEASRGHQLLLELLEPVFPARGALVSRGDVRLDATTTLTGADTPPPGWVDCPPVDTGQVPAVAIAPGTTARLDDGRLVPGAQTDSAAGDSATYEWLGRLSRTSLAARADITLPPGAIVSPAPDQSDCQSGIADGARQGWGDPARSGDRPACERAYPVVHAAGDLTVTGGAGQGVLLVDGRLRVEGSFLFAGVVIAKGGVHVTGSDVRVYGGVLSGAGGLTWQHGGGIWRSTCAVNRAARAGVKAYPVPRRPWAELL